MELKASYLAAKVAGFDADSVADVEAVCDRMTAIWWHVGQLKPDYLCHLTCAALPENSGQLPLWREIAEEVMQQLDERSISIVVSHQHCLLTCHAAKGSKVCLYNTASRPSWCLQRRSWHNYSKRMAKIAVGVSRWVRRLQAYALQPPEGLVTNANRSLEVRALPGSVGVQPLLLSSAHAKQRARTCACTQHVALAFAAAQLTAAAATLCRSCWRSPATWRALCRRSTLPGPHRNASFLNAAASQAV